MATGLFKGDDPGWASQFMCDPRRLCIRAVDRVQNDPVIALGPNAVALS